MQTAVIFILLAMLICITMFVWSSMREGVRPFEITEKDRADLKDIRQELGFRRVLGRLLGMFGGILIISGVFSGVYPEFSARDDWGTIFYMIALGLVSVLCGVRFIKHSK
jgi:hypothetical protein